MKGSAATGSEPGRAGSGRDAASAAGGADDDADLAAEAGQEDALADELAEIDALLARSSRLLAGESLTPRGERPGCRSGRAGVKSPEDDSFDSLGPLIRDLDWDEDQRLGRLARHRRPGEKHAGRAAAAIAWEAWQDIEPLQHQHWLGTLLGSVSIGSAENAGR